MSDALADLLAPLPVATFFAEYFERSPVAVHRQAPAPFSSWFSVADVEEFLAAGTHVYPDVYLVDAANPALAPADYCGREQRIDVARLFDLHAAGATIVLFGIHAQFPALAALCRGLERRFAHPFDCNAYLSPPHARGLPAHYDNHDVFALQIAGAKTWTLRDMPLAMPLPGQSFSALRPAPGPVSAVIELAAGDTLYCPRGLIHSAASGAATSLHLTIGLKGRSWAEAMLEIVAGCALEDPEFRRLLPAVHGPDAVAQFRRLVARLAATDPLPALDRLAEAFVAARPYPGAGQLGRLVAPGPLSAETRVAAWPDLLFRLVEDGGSVTLVWQGPELTFPAFVAGTLRAALGGAAVSARSLAGGLDEAGCLVLLRRLAREGVVAPVA